MPQVVKGRQTRGCYMPIWTGVARDRRMIGKGGFKKVYETRVELGKGQSEGHRSPTLCVLNPTNQYRSERGG